MDDKLTIAIEEARRAVCEKIRAREVARTARLALLDQKVEEWAQVHFPPLLERLAKAGYGVADFGKDALYGTGQEECESLVRVLQKRGLHAEVLLDAERGAFGECRVRISLLDVP